MSSTKRHSLRFVPVLLVLFLLVALIQRHSSRVPVQNSGTQTGTTLVAQARIHPVSQNGLAVSSPMQLDAKDVDAAMARRLLAKSLWEIVNAKSYKLFITT